MSNDSDQMEYELLCVIVNFGQGSKVIKYARQNGILGGTIFLGTGIVSNRLLEFLDLSDLRREIVLMLGEKIGVYKTLDDLNAKYNLNKSNHGIAFSSHVLSILGTKSYKGSNIKEHGGVENTMHNAIYVVVDKGKAEDVVEAAKKAGARGGTIINARGSGIHEHSKLFLMDIEPEKEVVLILAENNLTDAITSSIRNDLKMDEPGNGIIFVQAVSKAYGLC
ncbi:P-II family nitrogen regulator [Acetivibrio cellulolyticus]|uniref:P-II family nitrogen regulator n=1 Tax=Acetivibrio cellulolyticus TaxID=35830 RepID=UPI0001E2BE47|nr:P-II family nitrogen regulator [Acetivibrio cellulolyticus]